MKTTPLAIPEVVLIEPAVFPDARGFFLESWNARRFAEAGIDAAFVQDNHSRSVRGTLRGLHYQIERTEGKLVRSEEHASELQSLMRISYAVFCLNKNK